MSNALRNDQCSALERAYLRPTAPAIGMYWLFLKTKKSYPEVADTTIIHSPRWEGLLSQICKGARLPKDPTFAIHRVPALSRARARDEGTLFSVFVPVPNLGRYDGWKFDALGFKDTIVTILHERLIPGLPAQLLFADSIDPRHSRDLRGGALVDSNFGGRDMLYKFHYRLRRISNLFVCGSGVHGLWGLSGGIMSASALAEVIGKEFPTDHPREQLEDIAARSVA